MILFPVLSTRLEIRPDRNSFRVISASDTISPGRLVARPYGASHPLDRQTGRSLSCHLPNLKYETKLSSSDLFLARRTTRRWVTMTSHVMLIAFQRLISLMTS